MKLTELDAYFIRYVDPDHRVFGVTFALAHGVRFECPKCHDHQVGIWFKDKELPDFLEPKARWTASGTGLDDLTLAPSINILTGCKWHGHVTKGETSDA